MNNNYQAVPQHATKILYLHNVYGDGLKQKVEGYSSDATVRSLGVESFLNCPDDYIDDIEHIIVCAETDRLHAVVQIVMDRKISMGILPQPDQKILSRGFQLPASLDQQLELAFRKPDDTGIALIRCNGLPVLVSATIGRFFTLDTLEHMDRWAAFKRALHLLKGLRLVGMELTLDSGRKIDTASCAALIMKLRSYNTSSKMVPERYHVNDGLISILLASPVSIKGYVSLLFELLMPFRPKTLPTTMGIIKSRGLTIKPEDELDVIIDGLRATTTPARIEIDTCRLKLNTGLLQTAPAEPGKTRADIVDVNNLPSGSEVPRAIKNRIPLFPYASEERFRDLLTELRKDARINSAYIVLMILSTLLATTGLFINSTSVVIGAMLLAPLMAPIVSMAMGILRFDAQLIKGSTIKILVGILIALTCAMLFTTSMPSRVVTDEMLARLNPSLLDLAVAIFAGVAGAYTKSYREIMQSLAGVAIAVALVPPLSVAGIGLGRGDPVFFANAFLLFFTNLIGIVLFALLTFRVLGFSAVIRAKNALTIVMIVLAVISVPLYFSYSDIVENIKFESSWQTERFMVNDKYIIVKGVTKHQEQNREVITMDILTREILTREDLILFKNKIRDNFSGDFFIRANMVYIL